jgi:HSP20 family protein
MNYMISRVHPAHYSSYEKRPFRWMERQLSYPTFPVDIEEKEDRYILTAQLPGVKADDLQISVEKDVLKLEGSYSYQREEDGNYLLTERMAGEFTRSFRMPSTLDTDKVEARLADGILTLEMQKPVQAQPKTIKVN